MCTKWGWGWSWNSGRPQRPWREHAGPERKAEKIIEVLNPGSLQRKTPLLQCCLPLLINVKYVWYTENVNTTSILRDNLGDWSCSYFSPAGVFLSSFQKGWQPQRGAADWKIIFFCVFRNWENWIGNPLKKKIMIFLVFWNVGKQNWKSTCGTESNRWRNPQQQQLKDIMDIISDISTIMYNYDNVQ